MEREIVWLNVYLVYRWIILHQEEEKKNEIVDLVFFFAAVDGGPSIRGLQRITSTDPADGM